MSSWKLIVEKLITENCLLLGHHSKFTSKKIAKYLIGRRDTTEIFKLYELRYLLLKIYPFIHNLFHNPRINPKQKFQNLWFPISISGKESSNLKKRFSFLVKRKNIPPQILFASVTPAFGNIISSAAHICHMPWHKDRWLSGSITAAISYPFDKFVWQYLQDLTQKTVVQATSQQWKNNKENEEKIKEKIKYYNFSRWPSLLVVPDIANNTMILKEAQKVGLPIIGLVNSHCHTEIDYPIFAQDQTLQSIHFFCHFLAVLIAKESFFLEHKRYTLQKAFSKKIFNQREKIKESQKGFSKNKKIFLDKILVPQKKKEFSNRIFFFKIIKPWQKRFSRRYFFLKTWRQFYFLLLKKIFFRKNKFKKKNKKKLTSDILKTWFKQLKRRQRIKNKKLRNIFLTANTFFKQIDVFSGHVKSVFNLFEKPLKKTKPTSFFLMENQKKYFQKNLPTKSDRKQIRQKLQNFLWFPRMINYLTNYDRLITKPFHYATTAHYFKHSLQQWSQNLKFRNRRRLVVRLLKLPTKQKERIEKKKERKKKTSFLKNTFDKKNDRLNKKMKPPLQKWKAWVKHHSPNASSKKTTGT